MPYDEGDLVEFDRNATTANYGLLHGQWHLDATKTPAQLAFGFGLGYTTFELRDVQATGDLVTASVTNTGNHRGCCVAQVYGSVEHSSFERPPKRLMGFTKLRLDAGQSHQIEIDIDSSILDIRSDGNWIREDLPVTYWVGFNATDALLNGAHSVQPKI